MKEQMHVDLPEKQMYGHRSLKVELYEAPEQLKVNEAKFNSVFGRESYDWVGPLDDI